MRREHLSRLVIQIENHIKEGETLNCHKNVGIPTINMEEFHDMKTGHSWMTIIQKYLV